VTGFAAGLSENPELVQAVQEAVAQVRAGLGAGGPPDLVLLFVTPHHRSLVPEAAKFVRDALRPGTLLGCAAESIVGGSREVERSPGLSLWAGRTGPATPFHLTVTDTPDGPTITGWPDGLDEASAVLVLADPFSFPAVDLLARMDEEHPGIPLVGGMALASPEPGENQLVIDDRVVDAGAVGVLLGPAVQVTTVVSQGCRPIGDPFVVTRADGPVVYEMGGRPPLDRLKEVAAQSSEADLALLKRGLHLGRVIDEHKDSFGAATSSSEASSPARARPVPSRSTTGSRWVPPPSSRCATPPPPTRTCATWSATGRPTLPSSSPATAAGCACSPDLTTTPPWCATAWAAPRWPACSAPERSAPSVAATSSTASPPRWRSSPRRAARPSPEPRVRNPLRRLRRGPRFAAYG